VNDTEIRQIFGSGGFYNVSRVMHS